MLNWALVFLILFFAFVQSLWALDKDFFNHQKKIKIENQKRLNGADAYTKKRERLLKIKKSEEASYRLVRKRQETKLKASDLRFEKDFKAPPSENKAQLKAALRYANKKRRKSKDETWEKQNLEYGIESKGSKRRGM